MFDAGLAYIVIPVDIEREKYISECYKTGTVSIFSEYNGYSNRVPIDIQALNFIEFPQEQGKYGSAVSFNVDPVKAVPIITGIYLKADQIGDLTEHQFKLKRELNGNLVEISGSPDGKYLSLGIKADKAGAIKLNVASDNNDGKIELSVNGNVELTSNDTEINQTGKLSLKTFNATDENDYSVIEQTKDENNFKSKEHNIDTGVLRINDGEEPFILGNTFKKLFDDFIDEVSKTTVSTAIGQMPILNAQQVADFKEKTKTILSEVGFINK